MSNTYQAGTTQASRFKRFTEKKRQGEKTYMRYRSEAIWSVVWNLVWLWIINNVQDWNLSFLTGNFSVLLPVWNINIIIQLVTNAGIIFIDKRWLRYLMKAIMEAASFVTLIATFYLYPFVFANLTGWGLTDFIVQIGLVIGMVVTAISVIVYLWKMLFWN